ncbi:hypothetical protein [Paraburkholderia silvatlantica]|uniref:Uncharacterized protein n=1 Tax=Paraburkholderia silvatlantica TaxID=321895 RepID=A0ABR6FQC2_9BURK|nr:hypothetical protein [Paraburkholderia silvatlantica]MBB2929620.1 hypothetical protein [Paraburkholderia silvatlantica]
MSRRLPGTPSSLGEIVWKNCLGGMYGFGESARPPALSMMAARLGTRLPMNRIEAGLQTINYNSSNPGATMNAASEPSCGLWRESRQKSRGVLYGKTLIH